MAKTIKPTSGNPKLEAKRNSEKYTAFRNEYQGGRNAQEMKNAGNNAKHYSGSPASRGTGQGTVAKTGMASGAAPKKLVKSTQKSGLKKSSASPQAKAAQRRINKK